MMKFWIREWKTIKRKFWRFQTFPVLSFSPLLLFPLFPHHHATLTWTTCVIPMNIGSRFQRSEMCVTIQPKSDFTLPHLWLFFLSKKRPFNVFIFKEEQLTSFFYSISRWVLIIYFPFHQNEKFVKLLVFLSV